ncbi:RNA polymerase sigma factor [Pedobacter montanisoli]|uniref:Sigma-70 family RNA polymerase sigma factor n=1 Tax=Pedobacter montanisoli TaxID=2923277 RepID=A0ABS9ZUZ4_9SPHI|nr:sigma-70 family RNA polymerase sigma factor [Pedobacter montanisoli]MCJ0742213.1 sigma-70 family RNA polymerase sigma factor [Pedobacter montanisoli]
MDKLHYETLIEGCILNRRDAQKALYKMCYEEMMRLCMRYLKTHDLAKEALNSGFLKIFNNIGEYNPEKGNLMSWIRTILIRTCIDLERKEFRFTRMQQYQEREVAITPAILEKLYAQDILYAIRKLPTASQVVFNLSVIDGYSHKEIGELLGIGESTSRWHLSSAKKQLREILSENNQSRENERQG